MHTEACIILHFLYNAVNIIMADRFLFIYIWLFYSKHNIYLF